MSRDVSEKSEKGRCRQFSGSRESLMQDADKGEVM
jgi:hypothetical protein